MKVAILFFGFFALCMPALGDLAAGKQALQNGDYAAALKEFLPLAEQGDAEAQINLGFMYRDGDGVPQDDKEAMRWFRLAAEQGLANGQFNLGFMYGTGHGVPRDDKEAVVPFGSGARTRDCAVQPRQHVYHWRRCSAGR